MSFIFLLGILACCISGFVSINRFGFAIEGALCSLNRIYYDSKFGQLKEDYPKWGGFSTVKDILDEITTFKGKLTSTEHPFEIYENNEYINGPNIYNLKYKRMYEAYNYFKDHTDAFPNYQSFETITENFEDLIKDGNFLDKCDYYGDVLKGCMKILAMIYYCLFLIAVTFAGVSMMFYVCLKRQGYLLIFMHVLWNIIRFFMFSFFIFGAAYGMFFKLLKDSVAIINQLFLGNIAEGEKDVIPHNQFLDKCIKSQDYNIKNDFDEKIISSLEIFFTNFNELLNWANIDNAESREMQTYIKNLNGTSENKMLFTKLINYERKKGGLFGSFNCGFLERYLQMAYITIYDASKESRNLSALSLSAAFFGAVAIYFYLLVLHHYNNELFFDSGKSIFTGFDGFGGGYKKKKMEQDPAYKKRKLRAEIELTSKNDEASNYKDVNKKEEEDD